MSIQALVASMESNSYEDGYKNKVQFMKKERRERDLSVLNLALLWERVSVLVIEREMAAKDGILR